MKNFARNGNVDLMNRLADMYANGICVEINMDEAKYWFNMAYSFGNSWAGERLKEISDT